MVRRRNGERSLFEVFLPDGHKLWPDWLRRIDALLEDEAVIETVVKALKAGWPQSRRRGRPGTPAEIVLRMLVLKHLFDWSDDDLEQEVRANLVYRAFTRIDAGEVPDAKTILKIANVIGPDTVQQLHRRAVEVAARAGVTRGRRLLHRHHRRRNERALSDRQRAPAGRRAGAETHDAAGQCHLGRRAWPRPQSDAQRGRRVLAINLTVRHAHRRHATPWCAAIGS